MKSIQVAIISDIHGNLTALEHVLTDIRQRGIPQIYCLGDLVDFAPWGNEVISLFKQRGIPCLLGNHDERIAFDYPVVPLTHHDAVETANRDIAIAFSKRTISPENKLWLSNLPFELSLTFKVEGIFKRLLLVHATPSSNEEYLFEEDDKGAILSELARGGMDVLVMGHTHYSYIQQFPEALLVNCGSVGRSKEADRKATYTILTISADSIMAEIQKVEYPIQAVADAIYNSEIPDFYADFLLKS
ncbi:metallophosphoesterase family protein [Sphingobacterium faecale]|uniref:Metallophosphoesterase family protein n=1 Tax=Sphingobacterium faecale TaxID=2803775 RepID=A0ABS1R1G2_9SPHI|nr:metallophosphoesterase family protein [Sphingobacterium faecale]MBL1408498.1 metallophosphoesterase family protein [Sphingobacterium faecale]